MKLVNYDSRELILNNVHPPKIQERPAKYTRSQYRILRRLVAQKKITEQFFGFLLSELYGLRDWRELTYGQMYELIHILTFYDYGKGGNGASHPGT